MTDSDNATPLPLHALVEKARQGDAESFGELVRRHRSQMLGWANRVVRSAAAAEDVVQDALVQTMRGIGKLEQPDKFVPWLRTIVRNQALMAIRRKTNRDEIAAGDAGEEGDGERTTRNRPWGMPDDGDPQKEAIGKLVAKDMKDLLSRLSERDRTIAEAHLLGGLSVQEVARLLNMKEGAVYTAVSRSRKKLAEARYEHEIDRYVEARRKRGRPTARRCERARYYAFSGAYNTMASVMTMTMEAAGNREASLTDAMAATGHAFRIQVAPDLGVSGPYAYDWAEAMRGGWRRLGYAVAVFGGAGARLDKPDELVTAMDALLGSLERGVPAVAWNVSNAEFGMIEGFDDAKRQWTVTDTSASGKALPYAKLGRLSDRTEWFAAVPTGRIPVDRAEQAAELFERTARHMRGDECGGIRHSANYGIGGIAAYRIWIEALDRQTAAEPLGVAYNAAVVREARTHAAAYLRSLTAGGFLSARCPSALPAVTHAQRSYGKIAAAWEGVCRLFPLPFGADPTAPGPADRAARLLERAAAAERDAVSALEEAAALLVRRTFGGRR
ncbi:RNA polymerase sigma factor [Paenibacillus sp. GYB003]|uniref:RNA polymerase sigma factor n=1 Tax=Paenibacillus sp. GYB003 TaxID=2994392 RepID=UPI002F961FBC